MEMSELKQRLLKIELARIGFREAKYNETCEAMFISPSERLSPRIFDNGEIHYSGEYSPLCASQFQPMVERVNEIVAAWENGRTPPVKALSKFRILSEYNNVVLAARDDSKLGYGYGFHFVTWKCDPDRTCFIHGNYTTDYAGAKEDFAARSGLIDRNKMFNETELKLIHQGLVRLGADFPDLTAEQMALLGKVVEQIETLVPAIQKHEELEHQRLVPDDGLEV